MGGRECSLGLACVARGPRAIASDREWAASHHQHHLVTDLSDGLIRAAELVCKHAGGPMLGHDTPAHLVGDEHHIGTCRHSGG